ncbi:hypothetical protein H6P81_010448 [Aristolochia fimbriata]|uniref:Retrotransposon gag protein n=1 Tax=Aristolochia fimbriata TaxID=158543 RepID=A0AAV7ET91_ARIFI|nr:hypothetical protein H6P81_010448 [Aristolochia fimbriata]
MCGGGHQNHECQANNVQAVNSLDQANYVSNFRRSNDPYNNTYNSGWRNHPNFSWSNNNQQPNTQQPIAQTRPPPGFQKAAREPEQKSNLEDMISKILANQEKGEARTEARLQTQEASIRNLEIQVGQLANAISARAKKDKLEEKFSKFIDIFKKLEINIPFVEALMQMPQYAKFLKEVLSGKRKIEEQGTVMLTESCSAILKNQLTTKLKDPGSFTIPCEFENFKFNKVLCDLGTSINLMPLCICRKLNLGELKETNIMLQFADRSTKRPNGLIEDVLVRIGKFIYPCNFVVLDMEQEIMMKDSLERCLAQSCTKEDDDPLMQQEVEKLEAEGNKEEDEGAEIKDPSKLELKPLPSSLKYVYLENDSKPVIISSYLNAREEKLLIEVLSEHKKAIGWTISDIKGISPTTCMHKIQIEDTFKPTIQPQRIICVTGCGVNIRICEYNLLCFL